MRLRDFFASGLDPVDFARSLDFDPDPWQVDVLRSRDKRLILNIHRQGGKTTVAAIVGLHRALYRPHSTVLIVSTNQERSKILYRKALAFYRSVGRPITAETENQLSLTLENGSEIIATASTDSGIRGYSVDVLIIDEASRVEDDVWGAIYPMLAITKGRVIALSTPWRMAGWWYEATKSSKWRVVTIPATECPRLTEAELREDREVFGERRFRTEYLCEFLDASGAIFSADDIARIFSDYDIDVQSAVPMAFEPVALPAGPVGAHIRSRARLRHVRGIQADVRRRSCHHFWGPPESNGFRRCMRCEEAHP